MTPIYVVDAFSATPFAGNPAGVCFPDGPRDDAWLRGVAAEMRHSETAFLWPEGDGWSLRWFTPTTEVTLCGHATLASAHILWETERLPLDAPARFATLGGMLSAQRVGEFIAMDFPARPIGPVDPVDGLAAALGAEVLAQGGNGMDLLAEVADEATVRNLEPDMAALAALPMRGLIVTAPAPEGAAYQFVSRFFAPAVGVPEDPATGSAHCALAPYWSARLGLRDMVGLQLSPRGAAIFVSHRDDRVILGGQAVTVLRGELAL